jgi:hypothetical protein
VTPKKSSAKGTKEFLGKKEPMSPYIDHDIWPYMAIYGKYGNVGSFFMIFCSTFLSDL